MAEPYVQVDASCSWPHVVLQSARSLRSSIGGQGSARVVPRRRRRTPSAAAAIAGPLTAASIFELVARNDDDSDAVPSHAARSRTIRASVTPATAKRAFRAANFALGGIRHAARRTLSPRPRPKHHSHAADMGQPVVPKPEGGTGRACPAAHSRAWSSPHQDRQTIRRARSFR